MSRISQAALVEAVNQVLPENTTWFFSGDVPETLTEEFFNMIKWLPAGQPIHGDEVSLESPVSFKTFNEVFEQSKMKYSCINGRKNAYPSIVDQLDMLWHAIDTNALNETSDFYLNLKAVKDQFPKPE